MAVLIHSSEMMIERIREMGMIPMFRGRVPGWSIEEMTDPGCWFTSSDELGPWDWKVNVVQEGDIAFGKYLGGKTAFATVEFYAHLMNYRRSLPKYRVALGEGTKSARNAKGGKATKNAKAAKAPKASRSEILMTHLSPAALSLVRAQGSARSKEIRLAISEVVSPSLIKALGPAYKSILTPVVKKSISDTVIQFLEMGTWIVTGDIKRVYKGPNLEYKGWQESSLTTPDELFGLDNVMQDNAVHDNPPHDKPQLNKPPHDDSPHDKPQLNKPPHDDSPSCNGDADILPAGQAPFWARILEDPEKDSDVRVSCSPAESREWLITRILRFYPDWRDEIEKVI